MECLLLLLLASPLDVHQVFNTVLDHALMRLRYQPLSELSQQVLLLSPRLSSPLLPHPSHSLP